MAINCAFWMTMNSWGVKLYLVQSCLQCLQAKDKDTERGWGGRPRRTFFYKGNEIWKNGKKVITSTKFPAMLIPFIKPTSRAQQVPRLTKPQGLAPVFLSPGLSWNQGWAITASSPPHSRDRSLRAVNLLLREKKAMERSDNDVWNIIIHLLSKLDSANFVKFCNFHCELKLRDLVDVSYVMFTWTFIIWRNIIMLCYRSVFGFILGFWMETII